MTMAATALVLAGCSNDEIEGMDNGPVELRLTSGVTVQQTRAFEATQSTTISENEVVSVWVDDAGDVVAPLYKAVQLTANGSNGFMGESMYFPATGHNIDIYAIHGKFSTPFSTGADFPTGGVEYEVATDQSNADDKSNYTKSDLLYAYEKNVPRNGKVTTKELTFYHMLSKLELAIQIGDGGPRLADENAVTLNDVVLNGKFTPSTTTTMSKQSDRVGMLAEATSTTSDNMILGQQTCADFTTNNVFYNEAILVPQDMKDKKLTFKLNGGGTLTYTIPAFNDTPDAAKFESGKKYVYHITLDLTGVKVTSKIEPWEEVGPIVGSATMD